MGTRGFMGLVLNDTEFITYNHYDSYPDGLGADVLNWASAVTDWGKVRTQAARLRLVDEQDTPTAEELMEYGHLLDPSVSTGQDWYALLRECQGNMGLTLDAGVMTDGSTFPLDSLFCEWGYLLDLDAETFEVYRGFQKAVPARGRWEGKGSGEYKAVTRIASWPLDALPTSDEFLTCLHGEVE